jgi:YjbE family integral membrane protein
MDSLFWVALFGIVWIDLLLSGDNAVVIALVSRQLPEDQQKWGIIGGTAAAIGLRIVMSFFASFFLGLPALSILGGIFLLWVAAKLLMGEDDEAGPAKQVISLVAAIWTIAVADASMSLDNVMAIAALSHGQMALMAFGVILSIPLVIAGSAVISMIIGRFPILTWAGAGLLGWVAGGIITADPLWTFGHHYLISFAGLLSVLLAGWVRRFFRKDDTVAEAA